MPAMDHSATTSSKHPPLMLPAAHIPDTIARVLGGDDRAIADAVADLRRAGHGPTAIAVSFITPLLVETGHQWAEARLSVFDEHTITALCNSALGVLEAVILPGQSLGLRAVVGCAQGEFHSTGARIVAMALRERGWEVTDAGANVPTPDFVQAVATRQPAMVALSVMTLPRVPAAAELVAELAALSPRPLIIVGGRAAQPGLISGADLVIGRDLQTALNFVTQAVVRTRDGTK